jgi:hypothetical protein
VGLCAGAYLGSRWGWGLLPVDIDLEHWDRGDGPCELLFTGEGRDFLGAGSGLVMVRYTNGPTFLNEDPTVVKSLADFMTEYQGNLGKYPAGMKGSPAVVYGHCGAGLVVLVSPHMEDGNDESAWAPFRNIFRLCHCVCQGAKLTPRQEGDGDAVSESATEGERIETGAVVGLETITIGRGAGQPDISSLLSTPGETWRSSSGS